MTSHNNGDDLISGEVKKADETLFDMSFLDLLFHAMVLLEHCSSVKETGKDILFLIQLRNDADL